MAENIWKQKFENIYRNNETAGTLGGFFPLGIGKTWHSGIHIYNKYVMPIINGEIVACRISNNYVEILKKKDVSQNEYDQFTNEEQKFYIDYKIQEDPIKSLMNIKKLDGDIKEKISVDFILLKHNLLQGKLVFYSLHQNFQHHILLHFLNILDFLIHQLMMSY